MKLIIECDVIEGRVSLGEEERALIQELIRTNPDESTTKETKAKVKAKAKTKAKAKAKAKAKVEIDEPAIETSKVGVEEVSKLFNTIILNGRVDLDTISTFIYSHGLNNLSELDKLTEEELKHIHSELKRIDA